MYALRLRNIRSLWDTGPINLRPITLLLGRNSSGKSTFLRTLPLLTQSIQTPSNRPILWYGDLVDFGSITDVLSRTSVGGAVSIEINLEVAKDEFPSLTRPISQDREEFWIGIDLEDNEGVSNLKSFSLKSAADEVVIELDRKFSAKSVKVNGREYSEYFSAEKVRFSPTEIVPQLQATRSIRDGIVANYDPYNRKNGDVTAKIVSILSSNVHGSTSREKLWEIARFLRYSSNNNFIHEAKKRFSGMSTFTRWADRLLFEQDGSQLNSLRELVLLQNLADLLRGLLRSAHRFSNCLTYMGPTRATGERYYRIQELAIDKIDPQGRNLAMFLHSLGANRQEEFSQWLMEAIGYGIRVERSTGHVQVQLKAGPGGEFFNMADMGYGFSQVLPIMAQIWSRRIQRGLGRSRNPAVIAIEQPELHLHPAYQAKLADVFAGAGRTSDALHVNYVIETHSEALMNRLGELIADRKILPESVGIYIFEKDEESGETKVRESGFTSDGYLKDWPIGFFS